MLINRFPDKTTFLKQVETANVIPVTARILADTDTPVSLLKKFHADTGPAFLLESVEGGERWGRYSFLGASARSEIQVFRDLVLVTEGGNKRKIPHQGDPLAVLRSLMAAFRPAECTDLPRFWGGMVGYFSYETVSFFERIPNNLPEDTPLAHFMIPDETLIFDNIQNTVTVLAIAFLDDFESPEAAWTDACARTEKQLSRLSTCLPEETPPPPSGSPLIPRLAPGVYPDMVRRAKEYIREGEIIQAVVSQPFVCDTPPDLWRLYRAQRFVNPSPYLFFLHLGGLALVGSSPEVMVRLENGVATLRPIAGTRPRGAGEQEDRQLADELLQDEKERAEHLMLVDLGRNDLGRVAETGSVQVTDLMVVERYSHVMHLVSNITCDVKRQYDAWDLFAATFPAGTLSGAPKVRAMEIISELEQGPRHTYGGAVGYVSFSGNMDMAITIRTACIQDGQLTVRAGAGIVADSDPDMEQAECVNKSKAIARALELLGNSGKGGASCC